MTTEMTEADKEIAGQDFENVLKKFREENSRPKSADEASDKAYAVGYDKGFSDGWVAGMYELRKQIAENKENN